MVSNSRHVGDSRSQRVDEVKKKVPFNQKSSGIAYISNVEDRIDTSRRNFVCHGFYDRQRSWLYKCFKQLLLLFYFNFFLLSPFKLFFSHIYLSDSIYLNVVLCRFITRSFSHITKCQEF